MTDIKSAVAKNIAQLRVANKMTQLELAEKLNYSDKAVSKWEHGDSIPDLGVLAEIADIFGVTLDYLIKDEHKAEELPAVKSKYRYSKSVITLVAVLSVWFVAMFGFVVLSLVLESSKNLWLSFIYAVPLTAVVWLVLNSVWFNIKRNYFIISLLMWSLLAAIQITFLVLGNNIWKIYLLGIPGQIIILLWSFIKRKEK